MVKSQELFWTMTVWKQYRIMERRRSTALNLQGLLNKHFGLHSAMGDHAPHQIETLATTVSIPDEHSSGITHLFKLIIEVVIHVRKKKKKTV